MSTFMWELLGIIVVMVAGHVIYRYLKHAGHFSSVRGRKIRAWLILAAVVIPVALVVSGIVWAVQDSQVAPTTTTDPRYAASKAAAAPLEAHLAEYLDSTYMSPAGLETYSSGSGQPQGYIQGKLVVVNADTRVLDGMWWQSFYALTDPSLVTDPDVVLPERLVATSPEEVGTVVLLHWDKKLVGTYTNGARGFAPTCMVKVVDFKEKTIVSLALQEGSSPAATITDWVVGGEEPEIEDVVGSALFVPRLVRYYLESLPQK